jgi:uncharacterized membrane protein
MTKTMDAQFFNRNMHKIFLIFALFFGMVFSIAMPLFSEPDGQYHFEAASNIVGLTSDLSLYGETAISTGMDQQKSSYQDHTHFEKYYVAKIQLIPVSGLPRPISTPMSSYNFWGHAIPAVGIWLGYHIYPSLGVMVTFGRLLSVLVYSLLMFFIIKRVKHLKLLFAAVMLSPTVLNQFASFSYDSTGFVLSAAIICLVINTIDRQRYSWGTLVCSLLLIIATVLASKPNIWLMLVMLIIAFFVTDSSPQRWISMRSKEISKWFHGHKPALICCVVVVILGVLALAVKMTQQYGGIIQVAKRFFMTAVFNYSQQLDVGTLTASALASPYPNFNHTPVWTVCLWIVLIVLIVFSSEKFVQSRFVSWGSFILFFVGILGTFFGFLNFGSGVSSYIAGVQGRYFTASILLLGIWAASTRMKAHFNGYKAVAITTFVVVFITNAMLIFDTLVNLIVGA